MKNNEQAQRSQDIDAKTKQKIIAQSDFIIKNAATYLDIYSIPYDGNGRIYNQYLSQPLYKNNNITFSPMDSIEAGITSQKYGKTGILISCSHRRAGGGWQSGSLAQEENVSRASTWAVQASLPEFQPWYHQDIWLGQDGALILDGLLIFNEKNEELEAPLPVVFAGVAAANKAALKNDIYWHSPKGLLERQQHLIKNVSNALLGLYEHDVKNVILCAFGTNVFGWELKESIQVLHEASKFIPRELQLICAISNQNKTELAQQIYETILYDESENSPRIKIK